MVSEHSTWLRDNVDRQVRKYRSFADARMQQLASSSASVLHPQYRSQQAGASSSESTASPDARKEWRSGHSLLSSQDEAAVSQAVSLATKQQETALQVSYIKLAGGLCTCVCVCTRVRACVCVFMCVFERGGGAI